MIAQYNPKQVKNNRYGEVNQIYNFDYQQPGQPILAAAAQPALQTIQQPSASTKAHQLGGGGGGAGLSQAASAQNFSTITHSNYMSATSKKQVQMAPQHRTVAARDVTKRSGTTGGTSGGEQSKQGGPLHATGPAGTSATKASAAALGLQQPTQDGLFNFSTQNAASNVYTGTTGKELSASDATLNRNTKSHGGGLVGTNGRLQGGKSASVHSQKHISAGKIEQLRASAQITQENQYGQSTSFDKAHNSYSMVSQSQNFDFGKKNSVPTNNSRRRQAGQSLAHDAASGQARYQKVEAMPHLVNMSAGKPPG